MRHFGCILMFLLLFASCHTVRQTKSESVRDVKTDTVYRDRTLRDSIYLFKEVNTYVKGDTVYTDRLVHHFSEKTRTDTLYKVHMVEVEKEVEKEIEKEVNVLKWWQTALMWIGGISILITLYLLFRRFRKI